MIRNILFSSGDINGIGPEIALKAMNKINFESDERVALFIPGNVFDKVYNDLKLDFSYEFTDKFIHNLKGIQIVNIGKVKLEEGKPTAQSGKAAYNSLIKALEVCKENSNSLLITPPISKIAFKLAGIDFPGHTELLGDYFGTTNFMMNFLSDYFHCSLLTIHEPLSNVSKLLSKDLLRKHISNTIEILERDLGRKKYKIAVLGLNPHAGENGKIGTEEEEIFKPVIDEFNIVDGPFVPDAFFANKLYENYDFVLGAYHDQVLIPFKMLAFDEGVNYTSGLPIVRTSPDHGTAFDIAYKYKAKENSIIASYKWGKKILGNRIKYGK